MTKLTLRRDFLFSAGAVAGSFLTLSAIGLRKPSRKTKMPLSEAPYVQKDPLAAIRQDIKQKQQENIILRISVTEIPGNSLEEISNNMNILAPWSPNNFQIASGGYYFSNIMYYPNNDKTPPYDYSGDVRMTSTIHLPFPTELDSLSKQEQAKWEKFIKALWKHELNHYEFAKEAQTQVQTELISLLQKSPNILPKELKLEVGKIIDKANFDANKKHEKYDEETKHGKTEGVFLKTH